MKPKKMNKLFRRTLHQQLRSHQRQKQQTQQHHVLQWSTMHLRLAMPQEHQVQEELLQADPLQEGPLQAEQPQAEPLQAELPQAEPQKLLQTSPSHKTR